MKNQFGKTSQLHVTTERNGEKTVLKDLSFTAPYKVMTPFQKSDGGIQVMPLCASAGIMEGDCQKFSFLIKQGSDLEYISQSFEKIHKMKEGYAKRQTDSVQEEKCIFFYHPQPVIPFQDSDFETDMEVRLEDESAKFCFLEILSGGRKAHEELFAFRRYVSKVRIYRGNHLIYRDYANYQPSKMEMTQIGMYEGYSHMAAMFFSVGPDQNWQEKVACLLEEKKEMEGGITRLAHGDYAVRMFGMRAQVLQETAAHILKLYEKWFQA